MNYSLGLITVAATNTDATKTDQGEEQQPHSWTGRRSVHPFTMFRSPPPACLVGDNIHACWIDGMGWDGIVQQVRQLDDTHAEFDQAMLIDFVTDVSKALATVSGRTKVMLRGLHLAERATEMLEVCRAVLCCAVLCCAVIGCVLAPSSAWRIGTEATASPLYSACICNSFPHRELDCFHIFMPAYCGEAAF